MTTFPASAVVTIVLFLVVHLLGTVWWMSKITSNLESLVKEAKNIKDAVMMLEANAYRKEEAAKDFAYRDRDIKKLWEKVDALSENNGGLNG